MNVPEIVENIKRRIQACEYGIEDSTRFSPNSKDYWRGGARSLEILLEDIQSPDPATPRQTREVSCPGCKHVVTIDAVGEFMYCSNCMTSYFLGGDPQLQPDKLALDVSLEKARALHRVWRALNDGDCPKCHKAVAATEIIRPSINTGIHIQCPNPICNFHVTTEEVEEIERMFAPAMNGAVAIFEEWRNSRRAPLNPLPEKFVPCPTSEFLETMLGDLRQVAAWVGAHGYDREFMLMRDSVIDKILKKYK